MLVKTERILIIDGKPRLVNKARKLGLIADQLFLSELDVEKVVELQQSSPYSMIIAQSETGLYEAALLADRLKVKGTPLELVNLLADKTKTRALLAKCKIDDVVYATGQTESDIHNMFSRLTANSMILKPIDETGSKGVTKIRNEPVEIRRAFDSLEVSGYIPFMMEEYIHGRELSIETFSLKGGHRIVAYTDKYINESFVEIAHATPAFLTKEEQSDISKFVFQALNALGIDNGPAHTEIFLTQKGPKFIESHPRRGGDNINELVKLSCGVDIETMTFAAAFNLLEEHYQIPNVRQGAAIVFLTGKEGVVRHINGLDKAKLLPGVCEIKVNTAIGETAKAVNASHDRLGHVMAVGNNTQQALQNAWAAVNAINIDIV